MPDYLYADLRRHKSLYSAWRKVYQNGISSKSNSTREQVRQFEVEHDYEIRKIERELRSRKFAFSSATGVAKKKPGKNSKRPIVISAIRDRIVQRSILNTLQSHPPIQKFIYVDTSFGGIKDRGVPDAIQAVYESIESGSKFFIRSDIKSFFTAIPKDKVNAIINENVDDPDFVNLFSEAIKVELNNLDQLGVDADLFPIYEIGVAQGSCLSPLIGNLLLHDFDSEMNQGDITCIRYIDDFIILGPTEKAVNAAFKRALRILGKHGLSAYDPGIDKYKAERGSTDGMFTLLGCDIRPGMIKPNKKSKNRLLQSIKGVFKDSTDLMPDPSSMVKKHKTVTETLTTVSNIKKGWGNQYYFCNDRNELEQLDEKIDQLIRKYLHTYRQYRKSFEANKLERARLFGIHLLTDSSSKPIVK